MAAVAAGIPVISMDSGLDVSKELGALLHLGIDEYPSGLAAGEKMKALGKTSGACVNMEVGNVALDQRCQGFADALDGNSQVIATSNDPTEIRAGVTGYLQQHPEIDAVLTAGATAFDPTLAAIEEAGLGDQIALGSFDLSPTMLQAIDEGRALFGIDAQQYLTGYYPVIFLAIYDKYGMVPVSNVLTGPLVRHQGHRQAGDRAQRPGLPLILAPRRASPASVSPQAALAARLLLEGAGHLTNVLKRVVTDRSKPPTLDLPSGRVVARTGRPRRAGLPAGRSLGERIRLREWRRAVTGSRRRSRSIRHRIPATGRPGRSLRGTAA